MITAKEAEERFIILTEIDAWNFPCALPVWYIKLKKPYKWLAVIEV